MTIRFRTGPEKVICACIRVIRRDSQYYLDGASSCASDRRSSLPLDPTRPRGVSDERRLLEWLDATHDRAQPREFFVESFVPSIKMPQSLHAGGSVRDQTRQNQRGRRA